MIKVTINIYDSENGELPQETGVYAYIQSDRSIGQGYWSEKWQDWNLYEKPRYWFKREEIENLNTVKFAKLDDSAYLPTRAHEADAGIDLYSMEEVTIEPNSRAGVSTGIAVEIPEGYTGLVLNRSGLNFKRDITTATGVIDSGYTGAIRVMLENHNRYGSQAVIHRGDKIAQIVIIPCMLGTTEEILPSDLEKSERGAAGFGSTGSGIGSYKIVDD